ncbi:MAG: HAD family hydrolase [Anaerococcus sp.]|nr:HAD family hydrolase [Anaerococcus sp.]
MIKLFALDLDGTLLDSRSILRKENIKALRDLEASGVRVILASGRVFSSVLYQAQKISKDPVLIANNGALMGMDYDKLFIENPLDFTILEKLIDISIKNKLKFHFYSLDTYYSNELDLESLDHLRKDIDYGLNYQANLDISNDPLLKLKTKGESCYKFLINGIDKSKISRDSLVTIIKDRLNDQVYITSSYEDAIEITSKGTSKLSAIYGLCEKMGISKNSFAAIGDSDNDLEMLEKASLSFAMSNANDKVKNISDHILEDNDGKAISQAVEIIKEHNRCLI